MKPSRPVVLLAIGQTLIWACIYYIFPALLLRWEQDLGWSKAELTGAITLAVLLSGLAAPVMGRIIDRGRGADAMGGAVIVAGTALLVLSYVTQLWQFYLVWAVIGIAMSGCLYEPCFAIVTRARGAEAKGAIVFITLAAGFAGTISFPTVHFLAEYVGWRATVMIFGLVVIVVISPVLWLGARNLKAVERPQVKVDPKARAQSYLRHPAFWALGIGFGLVAIVHGAMLHHLLPMLDERGLPPETAVFAASFIGPMQVFGRVILMSSGRLVSHHGFALLAFCMMALSAFILSIAGASPLMLAGFIALFGAANGALSILRPVITRDVLGEEGFGSKSGALATMFLGGAATAPYAGALMWGAVGYDAMLLVLIGLAVVAAGLYWLANHLK